MPLSLQRVGSRPSCLPSHVLATRGKCVCILSFLRPKPRRSQAAKELLAAIQDARRGVGNTAQVKADILQITDALQAENEGVETTTDAISATWKLLWTTEKETLFILKNAGLFRTQAGDVYQVIDMANNKLQNAIAFPPAGQFLISSSLQRSGNQRLEFQFLEASLLVSGRKIPLPPVGKGWFDTVYLDDQIRVAKDSRGDTLVVERDGPPREL